MRSAALGLLVLLMALAAWTAARAFARGRRLTPFTSRLASLTYLLHAALVARVAWEGWWPLPVALWVGVLVGSPLLLGGTALCAAGVAQLGPPKRAPGLGEDQLVTGGVYRLSRNPQLVGGLLLLTGVSLLGGTAAGLGLTLGFGLLHHPYLVRVEEPHLRRVFGDPYRRYCGSVSRYLGVRRPRRNRG